MRRPFFIPILVAALGLAGCAANGDPPPGSSPPSNSPKPNGPTASNPNDAAFGSIEVRDVAILVLEQTSSYLRVTSSARRPRSAFGPAAAWNGTGAPTHTWKLLGMHGETLASGEIVARGTLEAPPNAAKGAPGVNVPKETFAFTVKVPQPEPGEHVEIAPVAGGNLVARWP